jgi:hypothetical protein
MRRGDPPRQSMIGNIRRGFKEGGNGVAKFLWNTIIKIPLVQPESMCKIIWDLFTTTIRIIFFLLIPVELAF